MYNELFEYFNDFTVSYPDVQIFALTPASASKTTNFLENNNISWQNIVIVPEYKGELDISFTWFFSADIVTDSNRILKKIIVDENKEKTVDYIRNLFQMNDFFAHKAEFQQP